MEDPWSISAKTTPQDQISTLFVYVWSKPDHFLYLVLDEQLGRPIIAGNDVGSELNRVGTRQSEVAELPFNGIVFLCTATSPEEVRRMFPGLMSRWMN